VSQLQLAPSLRARAAFLKQDHLTAAGYWQLRRISFNMRTQ